eukprot:230059-Pleurochrysis_carterae.AAC.1
MKEAGRKGWPLGVRVLEEGREGRRRQAGEKNWVSKLQLAVVLVPLGVIDTRLDGGGGGYSEVGVEVVPAEMAMVVDGPVVAKPFWWGHSHLKYLCCRREITNGKSLSGKGKGARCNVKEANARCNMKKVNARCDVKEARPGASRTGRRHRSRRGRASRLELFAYKSRGGSGVVYAHAGSRGVPHNVSFERVRVRARAGVWKRARVENACDWMRARACLNAPPRREGDRHRSPR